ncbi:UNVERIFIED_CONTAM: B2 protein [Sesamum calycinum]|uniref:B2 protein n=1 Tax=Sesamum calycinum TaxID=2727403 RepID=A0AAW2NGI4_9LAMI
MATERFIRYRSEDIVSAASAPPTNAVEATPNDPQSKSNVDCYQYRVFGLPSGKKEVVAEIKPGTKLFLYDFGSKLLYGIYEATSAGKLNLEPAAFNGKFPAQVKFKIFKECIPLPESVLKQVIKENYTGLKFKQELSGKQVSKKAAIIISSSYTSSSRPAPHPLAILRPMPATENQFQHTGRRLANDGPYLAEMQYGRIPPIPERGPGPQVNILLHGYHRAGAYMDHVNPILDHRSLPGTNTHHVANPQRPPVTNTVVHGVQEPTYSRYRPVEERAPVQITSLERRFRTAEGRAPHDQVSIVERQYREFPLRREAYQEYSCIQPQPSRSSPRGTQYQDSAVAYNSNPAAPTQYTASVSQPQLQATYHQLPLPSLYRDNVAAYNSYPPAPAHNIPSVPRQPQALAPRMSQGSAPVSSYYQFAMANRLNR